MSDPVDLYGTAQPLETARSVERGPVAFAFRNGAISHLTVGGRELLRQVAFLARDRDWGTLFPEVGPVHESREGDALVLNCALAFRNPPGRLDVDLTIRVRPDGLDFEAVGKASGRFETNRTGFTVLHPITGQAGVPVTVTHTDGQVEEGHFPERIAPWQPFMDMAGITHRVGDKECRGRFEGDAFEMEDQRQWGDASFKTYNRPIALPWPYDIADGEELRQAVRLTWSDVPAAAPKPAAPPAGGTAFPQTAILVTADHARRAVSSPGDLDAVRPQRLLCHVDASLGDVAGQFAAHAALQAAAPSHGFDLEMIGDFAGGAEIDPDPILAGYADAMRAAGFAPDSVMVCPSVDRQSTPPGSAWPPCPPLDAIHAAARRRFDVPLMGGGMASFFPELNRKRPPVEMLDFVTHSLCPIVHDAGDRAVMETLEAVAHITASARAIIGDRDYRIGPSTIAMRQNPYGARTIPNPDRRRVAMADDDPRHAGRFAAAYAVGLASAFAAAGISVWTPAELYGPRGLFAPDGSRLPLTDAIGALAACAGMAVVSSEVDTHRARLVLSGAVFDANLTSEAFEDLPPFGWKVRDDVGATLRQGGATRSKR
ncbi:conserved hypothetical protein [Aurantimonas manganoxydans SI85-9A1]|uniref:Uncharacterized protein n=1 Tax=Aurantimonas manganoxydans (strain ATCC BAA-1229 / DSM 21871 / SI85-9A1) TaxID=287752 RepID=Q1YLB7_AURMS|nr:hypothetical protein [Aurantimonas manganoxydans]EAS51814.1 conserved hypothetical protein [Aurantimonas manganoxydans SI85-9A1]